MAKPHLRVRRRRARLLLRAQRLHATVVEGCLGGSNPNYTITDSSGVTYKLNIPPTADASKLAAHVGESVNVAGNVNGTGNTGSSIDVQGIGKGTGTCPAGSKSAAEAVGHQQSNR